MGDFVLPDYTRNQCAIASEILKRFGINYGESALSLLNQNSKKVALVLLDGFGWNLFSRIRNAGQATAIKTTSVFPSTTATALVSLASGLKPGEHGVIGYKALYKEAGALIKPLESTYASSNRENQLWQIGAMKEMFHINTIFEKLKKKHIKSSVILPSFLVGSGYSEMIFSGATQLFGYKDIWEALFLYKTELENTRSKFVYFYTPFIDSIEHAYGNEHEVSIEAADFIFNRVMSITKKHTQKVTGIVTSDHGHITLSGEVDFHKDKALMNKLDLPPYGDGRAPLFRSRYNPRKELAKYNLKIFDSKDFKPLFGRVDKTIEELMPDFVGAPLDSKSYNYDYELNPKKPKHQMKSNHGGLSPEEMEIPIVLVD